MDLFHKLTVKNLKLNRKRTIVTIIGIILSVALITAVASIFFSMLKTLINYTIVEKGDYHVAYRNVPTSDLEKFENNREIEQINITKNIGYAKIDSKADYMPYAHLMSFTKSSLGNLSVKLVDGRLPENESEILIPKHLKTIGRLSLKPGDTITLNVGQRVDSDGKVLDQYSRYYTPDETETDNERIINANTKIYKIVGVMERPASNIEPYSASGYTFITYLDDQNLSGEVDLYTRYTEKGVKEWIKTTANILDVDLDLFDKIVQEQKEENGEINVDNQTNEVPYRITANSYLITLETNPLAGNGVKEILYVIAIVIGIIMVTSVFCIRNSFDISISEKIKQYGMLRSIGATKKQIRRNVFYEATLLGAIAISIGVLLGVFAAYALVITCNLFKILPELKFATSFVSIMVSIILSIVTIYFSAFRSARKAAKVSPIDSIRNSGDIKINPKKIKSPKIIGKIFGIGGEISFKNLKRNRKKYRTTVISITVSVLVFIALSSFMNFAFERVRDELEIFDYNISLWVSMDDDKEKFDKYLETTKLDNIEDCTVLRSALFDAGGDRKYNPEYLKLTGQNQTNNNSSFFCVCALGKEQYKKYINSLGLEYDKIKDKAIMMDYSKVGITNEGKGEPEYKTMRLHNYKTGEFLKGKIDNQNGFSLEIGHITDVNPFGVKNAFFSSSYLVISDELYDKIAPKNTSISIYYKSNNATQLQDDMEKVLGEDNYYIYNKEEEFKKKEQLLMLIGIFLYGFITVVTLIGITSIFNTITTNMELRKQEFAMLKSVGMTAREFNRMIRLETLFMGIKSLMFGLPIGVLLSYFIYYYLAKQSGIPYKFPIMAILISVGAVFVLISLIMRYSMSKINNQNTIETIRNENI